jgi:uncharacterized protein YdhG (YjbR/CyaY superfamily)
MRFDPAVTAYLDSAPPARKERLAALREECSQALVGFEERLEHGMPSYARDGVTEIAFASQKRYLSLYVLRNDVMDAHRARLEGLGTGKGCVRYRDRDPMDEEVIRSILRATAASRGPICE